MPTVDGGSLWDPLPVTLPTYVIKPKARRTVRTIDLSEPGTWSVRPLPRRTPQLVERGRRRRRPERRDAEAVEGSSAPSAPDRFGAANGG